MIASTKQKLTIAALTLLVHASFLCPRAGSLDQVPGIHPGGKGEDFSLVIEVKLINLFATVLDREGKVVRDLKKDDFLLWEDGKPQEVSHFSTHEHSPLSVAVLLDTSASMSFFKKLNNSCTITTTFARSLSRSDEMALFTFSDFFVKKKVSFTKDKKKIIRKLKSLRPHGETALYQALHHLPGIMGEPDNRQAVLLLTDGIDNRSIISLSQVLEDARRMQVPIYSIGFSYRSKRSPKKKPPEDYARPSVLQAIAEETGGAYREVADEDELAEAMKEIMPELRYQYYIGYSSNQDPKPGTYHKIRLETRNKAHRVRVRKGYYVAE